MALGDVFSDGTSSDEAAVLHDAELWLVRAKLTVLEQEALETLRDTRGIARVPLWPPSTVIQIVTCDGRHTGRVRREYPWAVPERWIAVPLPPVHPHGPYRSAEVAAETLRPRNTPQDEGSTS
ncbi:MAG TPA: hypothetical protein VN133_05020 [Humibacter sp.]|nr:hypothetical protein [Humibacter sp.]